MCEVPTKIVHLSGLPHLAFRRLNYDRGREYRAVSNTQTVNVVAVLPDNGRGSLNGASS